MVQNEEKNRKNISDELKDSGDLLMSRREAIRKSARKAGTLGLMAVLGLSLANVSRSDGTCAWCLWSDCWVCQGTCTTLCSPSCTNVNN
jgi:hypothetical protein